MLNPNVLSRMQWIDQFGVGRYLNFMIRHTKEGTKAIHGGHTHINPVQPAHQHAMDLSPDLHTKNRFYSLEEIKERLYYE